MRSPITLIPDPFADAVARARTITITVPMPVNQANSRLHWRTKLAAKKDYFHRLDLLRICRMLPAIPPEPIVRAEIRMHATVGARNDIDNLFARAKWPIDWLVTNRYLTNDDPDHLAWTAIPTQEVTRKRPAELRFTITPATTPAETP